MLREDEVGTEDEQGHVAAGMHDLEQVLLPVAFAAPPGRAARLMMRLGHEALKQAFAGVAGAQGIERSQCVGEQGVFVGLGFDVVACGLAQALFQPAV